MPRKSKAKKEEICEEVCFHCKDGGLLMVCDYKSVSYSLYFFLSSFILSHSFWSFGWNPLCFHVSGIALKLIILNVWKKTYLLWSLGSAGTAVSCCCLCFCVIFNVLYKSLWHVLVTEMLSFLCITNMNVTFQNGILASCAIKLRNFNAFAAHKLFADAASVTLSLWFIEWKEDFAIIVWSLQCSLKTTWMLILTGYVYFSLILRKGDS